MVANVIYKTSHLILLGLILAALISLIHTVNDKGINMHFYQQIYAEHCSWDVTTKRGTIIQMKGE